MMRHAWRGALALTAACGSPADTPTIPEPALPAEVIVPSAPCAASLGTFGGFQWTARTDGLSGPGPNVWSACNTWLDAAGLHLRVDRSNGTWTSAEVSTTGVVGYGRLEFEVTTRLDALDPNVVLGFFTYPGGALDGQHEIDIEFARFGVTTPGATNLNYVVYPGTPLKATKGQCAVSWGSPASASVHRFLWTASAVSFQSFATTPVTASTTPDHSWAFVPSGAFTISSGSWPLHLNLWLYGGRAPASGSPVEVVIRRVTHSSTLPNTPSVPATCR